MKLSRFTLRDLFWLVLVAGMGCGWWATWKTMADRHEAETDELRAIARRAEYIEWFFEDEGYTFTPYGDRGVQIRPIKKASP